MNIQDQTFLIDIVRLGVNEFTEQQVTHRTKQNELLHQMIELLIEIRGLLAAANDGKLELKVV